MDFLIVSDTHGNRRGIEEALARQVRLPDGIFFLGDGALDIRRADIPPSVTLFAVRGNCDYPGEGAPPEECVMAAGGHTVFLSHGHLFGVKSGLERLFHAGMERGADIILFGHTHKPFYQEIAKGSGLYGLPANQRAYLFNPGSLQKGSFGTLTITGDTVLLSHGSLTE